MQFAPNWIADTSFWYDVSTPDGHEFILVNTEAGTRDRAFDHEALARAISQGDRLLLLGDEPSLFKF